MNKMCKHVTCRVLPCFARFYRLVLRPSHSTLFSHFFFLFPSPQINLASCHHKALTSTPVRVCADPIHFMWGCSFSPASGYFSVSNWNALLGFQKQFRESYFYTFFAVAPPGFARTCFYTLIAEQCDWCGVAPGVSKLMPCMPTYGFQKVTVKKTSTSSKYFSIPELVASGLGWKRVP